jgi:tetratricopeptide (TPR) repeat protein
VFPDGQLYADLRGSTQRPEDPHAVAGRFLCAMGVDGSALPDDRDERTAMYRSQLAGTRTLVVLDDAASEEQVRPLLPGASPCAALVTSRRQLGALMVASRWAVPVLTPHDAVELLARVIGAERVAAERDSATLLADSCGRLSLALSIAGARLAAHPDWTLEEFRLRLTEERGRLDELCVGDLDVRASIGLSYRALAPELRQMFRRLGLIAASDWPAWVAQELIGKAATTVERMLDQLIDMHLVEPAGRDTFGQARFRLHVLVADFARERALAEDQEHERIDALVRVLEWYVGAVCEVSRLLIRHRHGVRDTAVPVGLVLDSAAAAVAWLDAELAALVAVAGQAAEDPEHLGGLLTRLVPLVTVVLQKRGRWYEVETLARLAAETARRRGESNAEATALAALSACDWRAGRYEQAERWLRRCLLLRRETGDREGEGRALHNLGWFYQRLGRLVEAIEYLQHSLQVLEQHGHPVWSGVALHNLAEAQFQAGDYRMAEQYLERSLAIRREHEDLSGLCITLVALGRTRAQRGRLDDALVLLAEGVRRCQEVGNREDEWEALLIRSEVLLRMGRAAEAESAASQVLAMTRQVGDGYGEAAAQRQVGWALAALGRQGPAQAALRLAAALFARLKVPPDGVLEEFFANRRDEQQRRAGQQDGQRRDLGGPPGAA